MFEIDLKRFVLQLLPTFYRQPLIFGLLRAALVGLQAVYDQFAEARDAHTYRLTHNNRARRGMAVCHYGDRHAHCAGSTRKPIQ